MICTRTNGWKLQVLSNSRKGNVYVCCNWQLLVLQTQGDLQESMVNCSCWEGQGKDVVILGGWPPHPAVPWCWQEQNSVVYPCSLTFGIPPTPERGASDLWDSAPWGVRSKAVPARQHVEGLSSSLNPTAQRGSVCIAFWVLGSGLSLPVANLGRHQPSQGMSMKSWSSSLKRT